MDDRYLLAGAIALLVTLLINTVIDTWKNIKKIQLHKTFAGLDLATSENTCRGAHAWDKIQLAMRELPVKLHEVCTSCGHVGGTGYKLNKAAMDIYQRNLTVRAKKIETHQRYMAAKEVETHSLIEVTVTDIMKECDISEEAARYFLSNYSTNYEQLIVKLVNKYPEIED